MKIIPQSATLLAATPDAESLIERSGRVCYRSGEPKDPPRFIRMLITRGHESVLEHASATLRIVTDRAVANELERHRLASFSARSTRYCDEVEMEVIRPPLKGLHSEANWTSSIEIAEDAYGWMRELGERPEIARSVLPLCLATELVVTANIREWRHILRLRLDNAAHPTMRELARLMLAALRPVAPTVFEEFSE
jgi:thymidylate synthase (FAD)